jgi:Fur family ferric uptake transcriptional regulator
VPSATADRDIEQHLSKRDIRYTKGRRIVIAALAGADGPRSAAELHDEIGPAVPLSSLYRSLAVLEEAGVVVPHFGTKGLTRYELAEWLAGHHHHVICVSCGAVEDIDVPSPLESQVRQLVNQIGASIGFTPIDHTLEIEGRCAKCS